MHRSKEAASVPEEKISTSIQILRGIFIGTDGQVLIGKRDTRYVFPGITVAQIGDPMPTQMQFQEQLRRYIGALGLEKENALYPATEFFFTGHKGVRHRVQVYAGRQSNKVLESVALHSKGSLQVVFQRELYRLRDDRLLLYDSVNFREAIQLINNRRQERTSDIFG